MHPINISFILEESAKLIVIRSFKYSKSTGLVVVVSDEMAFQGASKFLEAPLPRWLLVFGAWSQP